MRLAYATKAHEDCCLRNGHPSVLPAFKLSSVTFGQFLIWLLQGKIGKNCSSAAQGCYEAETGIHIKYMEQSQRTTGNQ